MSLRFSRPRYGMALMVTLAVVSIMFILCTAFLSRSESSLGSSSHISSDFKAYYLAEGGIQYNLTRENPLSNPFEKSFSLGTGRITLTVTSNPGGVTVRSQGESGRVKRTIVLNVNAEGMVERRYEE